MTALNPFNDPVVARALAYPYERPGYDYVLCGDGPRRLLSFDELQLDQSQIADAAGNAVSLASCAPLARDDRGWTITIASGSNGAPEQLQRKFADLLDGHAIIVLEGRIANFACVYSAHLSSYGAVPATLWPMPGVSTPVAAVILPDALIERMDETETIGVSYGFFELPPGSFRHAGVDRFGAPRTYLSLHGGLLIDGGLAALAAAPIEGAAALPAIFEADALEAVRRGHGGYATVADMVRAVVADEAARAEVISSMQSRPVPVEDLTRLR